MSIFIENEWVIWTPSTAELGKQGPFQKTISFVQVQRLDDLGISKVGRREI